MDTIGLTGTTCYINGERGTVTGYTEDKGRITGAFVSLAERPVMLYAVVGYAVEGSMTEKYVAGATEINRDQFDVLTGLDQIRKDCGWVVAA